MRSNTRALLLAASALPFLAAGPARAADATQTQAASMEAQIRQALAGLFGPDLKLPDKPVQVTPAGDHYDMRVVTMPGIVAGPPLAILGQAMQNANGTWSVSGVKIATPASFTVQLPEQPADPAQGGPRVVERTFTFDIKQQDGQILWDPTFATPSTWTSSNEGVTIQSDSPVMKTATIASSKSTTTMQPAGPGRSALLVDGALNGYAIQGDPSVPNVLVDKVAVSFNFKGVDRAKGADLMKALVTLSLMMKNAAAGAPPKVTPAQVQPLLAALQDLASSMDLKEQLSGFHVTTGGQSFAVDTIGLGFGGAANAGALSAFVDLGMDGLALPPGITGPFAALVPGHVASRLSVSNLDLAALRVLADQAMNNIDPTPDSIGAIFAKGGIGAALDNLALDVGGASFTGSGKASLPAPNPAALAGSGQIAVKNFDALMQKLSAIPDLAQAMPVLVVAKGLAHADGDRLVWDISYNNGKLLVNNIDVMAMGAGGPPRPAPAPAPRLAPAPPTVIPDGPLKNPARPNPLPNWAK